MKNLELIQIVNDLKKVTLDCFSEDSCNWSNQGIFGTHFDWHSSVHAHWMLLSSSRIFSEDDRKHFSVIVDEFADLAQEDFISFLDRARSSKMSVVVAHQEICDLQRISPEFAGRLMGNTSSLYAFLQKRPESAEMISGMAGTRTVWKHTMQTERFGFFNVESGGGSKREVEEYVIHPNLVKSLRVGKCVCIKKYPESRAYLVSINP